jgi:hypothetical protein
MFSDPSGNNTGIVNLRFKKGTDVQTAIDKVKKVITSYNREVLLSTNLLMSNLTSYLKQNRLLESWHSCLQDLPFLYPAWDCLDLQHIPPKNATGK